jgi:hypothetical protein
MVMSPEHKERGEPDLQHPMFDAETERLYARIVESFDSRLAHALKSRLGRSLLAGEPALESFMFASLIPVRGISVRTPRARHAAARTSTRTLTLE